MSLNISEWIRSATIRYDCCIRDTLEWMLDRPALGNGMLNTKVDPISGADYDYHSGMRGPEFTYGWIQGRGLEALVTFARHFRNIDPQLSNRLKERSQSLYGALADLQARDGHAYFLYNKRMQAIRRHSNGTEPQVHADSIYTYSDAFVAKGLFAAACYLDPGQSKHYLTYLMDVVLAIEGDRFQMDETCELIGTNVLSEPDDFGPRMILLGAAGLLHRNEQSTKTEFADRFISDVLDRYLDSKTGLLLNVPGQDTCNVGHAIEFCGFAYEHLQPQRDDPRIAALTSILERSLEVGLQGPGIALSLSAANGKAVSAYYPWWPMPEAIRACALGFQLTGNTQLIPFWKQADDAFFNNYWQTSQRIAYQTRGVDGPVDFVPATPDLDPGYHTGLSLLTAINSMNALRAIS